MHHSLLNDHNDLITDAMRPVIVQYVAEGSKFRAFRLAADAGVSEIQPLSFACPNAYLSHCRFYAPDQVLWIEGAVGGALGCAATSAGSGLTIGFGLLLIWGLRCRLRHRSRGSRERSSF